MSPTASNSNYFKTTTRRGHTYTFYHHPPSPPNPTGTPTHSKPKPTILFLHGFPSTHRDWSAQLTYFTQRGYGAIAPDMLGYGLTSAPEDYRAYGMMGVVEDVVDVLDGLGVGRVIGVGHDWGCFVLSRLLNTHIDYIIGAAFLVVGYIPPQPTFNYAAHIEMMNRVFGYDVFGYWAFFSADDAVALSEANIDSFYSLSFPDDPLVWRTDLAPLGKAREWIEQNKQRPRAAFWTEEEKEEHKKALMQKGLRGPYNWYKAHVEALNNADEQLIPQEAYNISIPTFFGGATKDQICLVGGVKAMMPQFCSNVTMKDFETSHWIMLEAPGEVNEALEEFFVGLLD